KNSLGSISTDVDSVGIKKKTGTTVFSQIDLKRIDGIDFFGSSNKKLFSMKDTENVSHNRLLVEDNLEVLGNVNVFTTQTSETGFCGIGAMAARRPSGYAMAGVGVNFRVKKVTAPSSITLTKISSNNNRIKTANLTVDGFWLYLDSNGTDDYEFWRGRYKA